MRDSGEVIRYPGWEMKALAGIGKALALLRERAGFASQEALARKLGLTQTTISRAEAVNANPRASTLSRYLEAIDADLHELAEALDVVNGRSTLDIAGAFRPTDDRQALVDKLQGRLLRLEEMLEGQGFELKLVPVGGKRAGDSGDGEEDRQGE